MLRAFGQIRLAHHGTNGKFTLVDDRKVLALDVAKSTKFRAERFVALARAGSKVPRTAADGWGRARSFA